MSRSKFLFDESANALIEEIAEGRRVTRWLDKELPEIRNTRADMVGETADDEIVHLEFQSTNLKRVELRMANYYCDLYERFDKHVHQLLLYVGAARLAMPDHFDTPTMNFNFKLVDIRDLDGERFLRSDAVSNQILSLLMHVRDRTAAVRQVLGTIAGLQEPERGDRVKQLLTLVGLRRVELEADVKKEIESVPIHVDWMEETILGEEFKKGEAKIIRKLLVDRFKEVPPWVDDKLAAAREEQLVAWAERILHAQTLDEVFA